MLGFRYLTCVIWNPYLVDFKGTKGWFSSVPDSHWIHPVEVGELRCRAGCECRVPLFIIYYAGKGRPLGCPCSTQLTQVPEYMGY